MSSDSPHDDINGEEAAQSGAGSRNREQLDRIGALLAEAQVLWEAMPDDDQSLIEPVGGAWSGVGAHISEANSAFRKGAWSGVGAHISEANSAFRKLDDLPAVDLEDSDTIIAFEHDGVSINNPFMSSCGRFEVDPRTYGFVEEETGGGCLALVKRFADGRHIMLTDEGGSQLPENTQDCMIGLYDVDREMLVCRTMSTQIALADAELQGDELPKPG
jgi:hypothetical protein